MAKKGAFLLVLSLIFICVFSSLVSAINLEVSAKPIQNSAITDLNEPAVFELTVINLGQSDTFELYSLVGVDISPKSFNLNKDETKTIRIEVTPQEHLASIKNSINFEYRIKDSRDQIQSEKLVMNIIELKDAFQITMENINPKSENLKITIKNMLNYNFEGLKVNMQSNFFSYEDQITLGSMETKEITVPLNVDKIKKSTAGSYLSNTGIEYKGVKSDIETIIKFLEQEGIEVTENKEGTIIKRVEITKTNVGNTVKDVEIFVEKNIISYLFTTFNTVPTEIDRKGLTIGYTWKKELIPNDKLEVIIKTNWFYPIIVIILAIVLFLLIKSSVEKDLILRKHVSYVKTKGGEFALKVSIRAKAKKFIERINITDKLPPLVELYERYGTISPDKVDLRNKRMEWNIESLNQGEERIFSYIIYSKIGVVGKFELPKARAMYEKSGKIREAESNRSFFINQPKSMISE